jgi:tRNA A37 methylthiotransferase MiaB
MVKDIADDLVAVFENEKVFKFLHLPVQSGDDGVLKRMRRCYTVQGFKEIVSAFRTAYSELTLATDVICGFPGETQDAFESTLRLIKEVKPDIVNISKFFPRPKTAAALMQNEFLEPAEIKRRSAAAAKLAKRITFERNQRWFGWTGEVLIDERGKVPGTWIGRNFVYKPVAVKSQQNLLGERLNVRVDKAFSSHLSGAIC